MDLLNNPFKTSPEEQARLNELAKNFPVTKLPYMGPRRTRTPKFDLHTHEKWRSRRLASPEAGISWSDLHNGMSITRINENAEQWIPDFANNDEQFQLVLAASAKAYVKGMGGGVINSYENLDQLKTIVAEAFKRIAARHIGEAPKRRLERTENGMVETIVPCDENFANHRTHVATVQKAGGYLERDAAVAYQSWRLRRNSTIVAQELGLTPALVRRILSGLCFTARQLGFDATPPQGDHTRGKLRNYRPNPATAKLPMAEELVALALGGKSFEEIAEQYGVKKPQSVVGAYGRGKKIVIEKLRKQGHTWEQIEEHFRNEPRLGRKPLRQFVGVV